MDNKKIAISQLDYGEISDDTLLLVSTFHDDGKYMSNKVSATQIKQYMTSDIDSKLDSIITLLTLIAQSVSKPYSEIELQTLLMKTPDLKLEDGATLRHIAELFYNMTHKK